MMATPASAAIAATAARFAARRRPERLALDQDAAITVAARDRRREAAA
jgi:hypothetical protein